MSRSNPALTNPAKHFFRWAGSTGQLTYWDKSKGEDGEQVVVKLPFEFMVLDELATITGYSKPEKSFYWSNEVRNTKKEPLVVKTQNGVEYSGFYKNEQGIVQMPKGAEYAQSIYIAYKMDGEWVIGNIKASGSARSAWFDYSNTCKPQNGTTVLTKGDVQSAQTGDFYPPVFTYRSSTPEEDDIAIALDKELQIYLNQYFSKNHTVDDDNAETGIDKEGIKTTTQDLNDNGTFKPARRAAKVLAGDIQEEPINLDDIPF